MRHLIRYSIVGLVSNVLLYLSYLFLNYIGVEHKVAMTIVYIVGAGGGFIGHQKWTFEHHGDTGTAALLYLFTQFLGYLLNLLILLIFVDYLGYAHQWVQAAGILIVAGFLFLASKYIVFKNSQGI